jgi:hypothetical protein
MPPLPTPEEWAHIHHEYENTRRSIEDICLEYRISPNTLRRRVKLWGWTMRHPPISDEGPEAVAPPIEIATAETPAVDLRFRGDERGEITPQSDIRAFVEEAPTPTPDQAGGRLLPRKSGGESEEAAAGEVNDSEPSPHITEPPDTQPAGGRLQGAAARVMRAIETTSARLTAKPVHLRETEMAARALGSLTRTLHELNGLLVQHKALEPKQSVEELRASLSRKLEAIIAERDNPPPENADEASPDDAPASI